jgi:RNA polymerase sigma factor (sigma-70 family)
MAANDATVFVLDDDASVRQGVARLIRSAGYSARTFSSPNRLLKEPPPPGPACLVLDMLMDGMDGLGVQDALRRNGRHIPIVFLSGGSNIPMATKAMKGGADDFLVKPFSAKDLLGAIRKAVENDRKASAARVCRDDVMHRYETLTEREREVMVMVCRGMLNKQVAAELGIAEKTVKVHRARAMEKMRVESLAELVRLAEQVEDQQARQTLDTREEVGAVG